ncbi:MAG: chloramphenicol acetyltransferase [Lachnospiraceae bacterium]|nr:chloramphenicol acetyltransferase [Lachnospiraceae bacterium]
MKKIDIDNWDRKEVFKFFSETSKPFYMTTFRLDVTDLFNYAKRRGISFYYSMVWCVSRAVNSVENFRYCIKNGEICLLDKRTPSFTDMKKGSEVFHIITLDDGDDMEGFCSAAAEKNEAQDCFIDYGAESDDLIYISSLPWFDMTALTNEAIEDPDDNVPRITWGRAVSENGRMMLGISFEVNHRFVDGIHFKKFTDEFLRITEGLKI